MKLSTVTSSLLLIFCFLAGCGEPKSAMNAEFQTLQECLKGIAKNSGNTLRVVVDEPGNVPGFLSNGEGFGCQKKISGTRGAYFEGWYMVSE